MKKKFLTSLCIALSLGCCLSFITPITENTAQAADFPSLFSLFGAKKDASTFDGVVSSSSYSQPDNQSLNLTWNAVDGADGYEILFSHNGSNTTYETTEASYTVSQLIPAALYTYQIRCYQNNNGTKIYGNYSTSYTAMTTISKVTGLTAASLGASVSKTSVNLSWDAQGESTYQIYYKKADDADYTLAGITTSNTYTLDGLSAITEYNIRVRAYLVSDIYAGEFSDDLTVTTSPTMVSNFKVTKSTTTDLTLTWDANTSATSYYIYRSVNDGEFTLYTTTTATKLAETGLTAGTVYSYKISAYYEPSNIFGPLSDALRGVTNPYKVNGLAVTEYKSTSMSLSWTAEPSATGYVIYRKTSSTTYVVVGSTTDITFTDTTASAGVTYYYRVKAYADTEAHLGEYSEYVKMSTLPARPAVLSKAGTKKLRLHWTAITGATGYYVYRLESDGTYTLVDTLEGKAKTSIVYSSLKNGTIYNYKVYAYRNACDLTLVSEETVDVPVTPYTVKKTTTAAYTYKTKAKLIKSKAWKVATSKKAAVYNKSYIIPGLTSTNVAGFTSTNMCPQAMCFAGKYMLITAYDRDLEENSVIYVLGKADKKLKTVIVLENKTHAGGMCYDGTDVWITYGKKLCSLPYSSINKAAKAKKAYAEITFKNVCAIQSQGSFATYYNDMIWVGSYQATTSGELYSYRISEDDAGKVALNSVYKMTIPSAVQGIAFTENGRLILSRAYSYTHQLDFYKTKKSGSQMSLSTRTKVVGMPSLNEGIDILGNNIYVNFESAVSPQAENFMDRVLAFNLKKLQK